MSNHFAQYEGRACTEKSCPPFFVREWETVLVGTLIAATLIYLSYSCGKEYFSAYSARGSTQKHFSVDDRPGHESFQASTFKADHVRPAQDGSVLPGAVIPRQGVSTEKFTEFARIDAIDNVDKEPTPTHQPATPDEALASLAY